MKSGQCFRIYLYENICKGLNSRVKLVLIKEKQSELKKITSLPLFNNPTNSGKHRPVIETRGQMRIFR